ncbi:hypothetical protein [Pelovirga terrestris]|uniref:SPOR domain-containing protein n=1 Tax=Pelovirga terrestris TaxID=2771352 RepID=A0A8J6URH6_9BACT|nr:hypothetical protein [Pelovirga terrestris]MBD1401371.1 hypothetical protein [Pelovirga terrestris]
MTEENHHSRVTPDTSSGASEPQTSAHKKRLEDLLIDDDAPKTTFSALADQEVTSGSRVGGSLVWPLVILALLIIVVAGVVGGWYQYGDLLSGQSGNRPQVRVEKRMTAPERPQPLEGAKLTSTGATPEGVAEGQDSGTSAKPVIADAAAEEDAVRGMEEAVDEVVADVAAHLAVVPATVIGGTNDSDPSVAAEVGSEAQPPPATEAPVAAVAEPAHRVLVGPFISQRDLERAAALLRERGFDPQQERGSGRVDMIRLLEGIYPLAQAQIRLEELHKDYSSAFLLPDGDRWALYIGSFSDRERARRQQRELAERDIQVAQVDSQPTIEGSVLVVVRNGLKAAEEVVAQVNASGLRARIEVER